MPDLAKELTNWSTIVTDPWLCEHKLTRGGGGGGDQPRKDKNETTAAAAQQQQSHTTMMMTTTTTTTTTTKVNNSRLVCDKAPRTRTCNSAIIMLPIVKNVNNRQKIYVQAAFINQTGNLSAKRANGTKRGENPFVSSGLQRAVFHKQVGRARVPCWGA